MSCFAALTLCSSAAGDFSTALFRAAVRTPREGRFFFGETSAAAGRRGFSLSSEATSDSASQKYGDVKVSTGKENLGKRAVARNHDKSRNL